MELIRLEKINKVYQAETFSFHALKDISLSIAAGEFISIIGQSGSGKTTLLDILGCISTPSSGEYHLDGVRVDTLPPKEIARVRNRTLGFIFQNFNLIPHYTLLENVELPLCYANVAKKERAVRARAALVDVGLGEKVTRFPRQLSGGERQRVAIARALVNKPSLLLADEPTGNLDSRTGESIMGLFHELHRAGKTIVMITHDSKIARLASTTFGIRDGELVPSEVLLS